MATYISSTNNRLYTAVENRFGQAAAITSANRFPAVKFQAHQVLVPGKRQDKTGSRTFLGVSPSSRRRTAFEVRSYLTTWSGVGEPTYGPLFQAAMGSKTANPAPLTVAVAVQDTTLATTMPHGLSIGAAISVGGEVRFVTSVLDDRTVSFNVPFSKALASQSTLASTVNYGLANDLPSVSVYDYWGPATAVHRFVTGASVDSLDIVINGDYHEFAFSGPACDLLDSVSFTAGGGGLATYPAEPAIVPFDYSIVPGHLGQAWLGSLPSQFFTLSAARIRIRNNVDLRAEEFGATYPLAAVAGAREVDFSFSLLAQDDAQSKALHACAKARVPISVMLQLGQQQGQVMGVYLPNVIPEIPVYDDGQPRLQWHFQANRAQGVSNDEVYIAFA